MGPRFRLGAAVGISLIALAAGLGACSSGAEDDPTAFCEALSLSSGPSGAVSNLRLDDPDSLVSALSELTELSVAAPGDLGADIDIVADVYADVLDAVSTTAPSARGEVLTGLQGRLDEAAAPSARLQSFGEKTCGLAFVGPTQPTPTPTPLDIDD